VHVEVAICFTCPECPGSIDVYVICALTSAGATNSERSWQMELTPRICTEHARRKCQHALTVLVPQTRAWNSVRARCLNSRSEIVPLLFAQTNFGLKSGDRKPENPFSSNITPALNNAYRCLMQLSDAHIFPDCAQARCIPTFSCAFYARRRRRPSLTALMAL
jgi:hypothetical protein